MAKKEVSRKFAQVPMPEWMFDAWYALAEDKEIEKQVQLESFVMDFINSRRHYVKEEHKIPRYLVLHVSPPGSKNRSLWLKAEVFDAAESFAKETNTRTNRIIFSATIEGLVKAGRILI